MKNKIRLTEAQLHRVIKESVTRILEKYDDAPWDRYKTSNRTITVNAIYVNPNNMDDCIEQEVEVTLDFPLNPYKPQKRRSGRFEDEYDDDYYNPSASLDDYKEKIKDQIPEIDGYILDDYEIISD